MQTKSVKFIFCSIVLVFLCTNVHAQRLKTFSNEAGTFVEELRKYYKDDKNLEKDQQKEYEALLIKYESIWLQFGRQEQAKTIRIANLMLGAHIRPYPGFYDFIKVQIDFKSSSQTDESYGQWLEALETLLQTKKTRDFTDLISTSLSLINENCLYESRTARWTSSSNNFYFKMENNMPVIVFDEAMDLTCSSIKDSNIIVGTKGVYYPTEQKWIGRGGKVFWSRNNLPENKCWAELNKYEAATKFSKFTADSALFMNTDYFKKPLLGRLEEDLGMPKAPEAYTFPKFRSYQKDFTIKNIFPDVDYSGGFSMNGAKFLATGIDRENATITIYRKGKPFIVVEGKSFFFNEERINSESVAAALYLDNDSIFNAGLQFRYVNSSKEVILLNDSKRNYSSPFENTYHKLDMYCEAIYWKMGKDEVDFSTTRASGSASFAQFESQNYYSESRYSSIKGVDNLSPLERVKNYCLSRKTRSFYIDEFTAYVKMDPIQAKQMIHNLAQYGFLSVNNQDEFVYVKQKLFDFSRSNSRSVDYDAIVLYSSIIGESNATLDLKNNDLKLRGVEKFVLSDTQNVVINPAKQELLVKKNRDLSFDGRILAGRFNMSAKKCYFSYDKFKVDLQQVDSLRFYVTSYTDNKKLVQVRTPLQNLKVELLIDRSDNKASLKHLEEYPILNSLDYSYAYYEEPYIQRGVYTQKRFYYKLNPFTIKRLFKFETDSLIFTGVLNSANIFPDITEPLKVQPDYSLGFVMKTPSSGLPLYGGKGHYFETIDLSYKGFLGRGKIEYLASETRSKDIIFMPDSLHAVTDTFLIREQYAGGGKTEFPDAKVGKAIERWYPYENKMYVYQDQDPFQMYKNEVLHHGYLLLTPVGLSGSGTSKMGLAEVVAEKFDFKQTNLNSNESEFKLQATGYDGLAFYSKNVKSKVDFKTRKGEFVSNDSIGRVVLPVLQYAAYIDKFTWEMDKAELAFANSKSESSATIEKMDKKNLLSAKMPGALYVSTNPAQDSLHFFATKANFKYKENALNSDQVFLIRVADAAIFPDNKKVSVKAAAKMDLLAKATIIADTARKYHQFYDANVQVYGRKSYSGNGYIDYIDENKAKQKIFLTKIEPNSSMITTGSGNIGDSSKFQLSPAFAFKGEIIVDAQQPNFTFSGGVQLTHNCKVPDEELAWMRFRSVIVPDSIYIPVPEIPTDFSGERATASILFKMQNLQPYSAFVTKDKDVDNEIISSSGFLTFNKRKAEYQIGSLQKLSAPQENKGNLLTLNQVTCDVKGEGRLRFGLKQDHVKTLMFGSIKVNNKKGECDGDIALGINFPFAKKAIDFMAQNIFDDLGVEMMDFSSPKLKQLFKEYSSDDSKTEKLLEELATMGDLKRFPEELNYTLLLTGIRLKYNPEAGYTYSGMAGLVKAGDKQQYKTVRTGIQLRHYRSSNILNIYIELTLDHWYFFSYEETGKITKMKAYSSLGEFNDMLKAAKPEERKLDAAKNGSSYEYSLAISRLKDNFIRAIQGLKVEDEVPGEEIEEEEILNDTDDE